MKYILFSIITIFSIFACTDTQKSSEKSIVEVPTQSGKQTVAEIEKPSESIVEPTPVIEDVPQIEKNKTEVVDEKTQKATSKDFAKKAELKAKQATENALLEAKKKAPIRTSQFERDEANLKAKMKAKAAAENAKIEASKRAEAKAAAEKLAADKTPKIIENPKEVKNETPKASAPSAESILKKVDKNMSSKTTIVTSEMVIHGKRKSRTVTSKGYAEGDQKSFTEYLSPAREKGTKMLKLKDRLWIYSPSTDRTIQLSGHMLKQSVMGSDLSYEDMMDDRKLLDIYNAKVIGEEDVAGRKTWVLELNAKVADVSYEKRKTWIDQERFVPLKEELFAKSGQLLKKTILSEVKKIQGRWFPTKMNYKDMLKTGKGTDFIFKEIQFDPKISAHIFSKASLKQ